MKYTLLVGIEYKSFNTKTANITISLNEQFVDCFSLDKDYSIVDNVVPKMYSKWYDELNVSHWLNIDQDPIVRGARTWEFVRLPKYIKVYQIDEEHLAGLLKIKVENDNNDYTNGFMKNSSLIRIPLIALFPSHMSANSGEKLLKTMIRLDKAYWKRAWKVKQIEETRIRDVSIKHDWPLADWFFVKRESEIHEKSKKVHLDAYIGGSFTAEISVEKKHKVFFLRSPVCDAKGFFVPRHRSMVIASYKPLLNIYNEDN